MHALERLFSVSFVAKYLRIQYRPILLGKDIEIALTEIRQLQNDLGNLKKEEEDKINVIKDLNQENNLLSE